MNDLAKGFMWGAGFALGAVAVFVAMFFALGIGLTFLGMLAEA